jgi:hypothetical protein
MSQYDDRVERQRLKLEAEKWSQGVKSVHAHSLGSMHYDNRPQDTEGGKSVLDVEFNDGSVKRTTSENETVILGTPLRGQDLLDSYVRNT